jgi:hypothetical protein
MTDTPDQDNRLAELAAAADMAAPPLEIVGDAKFRHSDAGGCARAIAYRMNRTPETNPPDLSSHHSFAMGHAGHGAWQDAIRLHDETALIEAEYTIPPADLLEPGQQPLTGCHVDAVVTTVEGVRQAVELKTVNEYGYKDAVIQNRGPKWGHRLQAALNAKAAGADEAVIIYLPMTTVSVGRALRSGIAEQNRHGAKWTYPRDVWEPWADWELARVEWVARVLDEKGDPGVVMRWWPDKQQSPDDQPNVIADPTRRDFPCRHYCAFYDQCVKDGA